MGNLVSIFSQESVITSYYRIVVILNAGYSHAYSLNQASALMNALSLVPLYLFIFRIRWLRPWLWQFIFFVRISFETIGHAYEVQLLRSLFYNDILIAVATIAFMAAMILPSYWACFRYAFRQKALFATPPE